MGCAAEPAAMRANTAKYTANVAAMPIASMRAASGTLSPKNHPLAKPTTPPPASNANDYRAMRLHSMPAPPVPLESMPQSFCRNLPQRANADSRPQMKSAKEKGPSFR